jgi:hypothetical protein
MSLEWEDGTWTENEQQTRALLVSYYKNLYSECAASSETRLLFQQQNLTLPMIHVEATDMLYITPTSKKSVLIPMQHGIK